MTNQCVERSNARSLLEWLKRKAPQPYLALIGSLRFWLASRSNSGSPRLSLNCVGLLALKYASTDSKRLTSSGTTAGSTGNGSTIGEACSITEPASGANRPALTLKTTKPATMKMPAVIALIANITLSDWRPRYPYGRRRLSQDDI